MTKVGIMNAPTKWRTFNSPAGSHLLIIDDSQIFDISAEMKAGLDVGEVAVEAMLLPILNRSPLIPLGVPAPVAPQSISLNVSSSCNLACTYCYAGQGSFGGAQTNLMSWTVARDAIDKLLSSCARTAPATIGFLGGEPLVNRRLIRRVVKYAATRGRALGQDVRFSVTTNGSLLNDDDIQMVRQYPFAVTVSIDGGRDIQETQRPGADFEKLVSTLQPLLHDPGQAKVSARATVTRHDFDLISRFDAIHAIGFQDIGFSPVRVGAGTDALRDYDWAKCLDAYRALGARELDRLRSGQRTCFANLIVALKQIHRGACAPYPCGAGGGYFSVASEGTWYACHRAIGDDDFAMGNNRGLDPVKRQAFLEERHVHNQTDCHTCWARYLCSGSCHQEARARTTQSCDFIRGWLEFCLAAYASLETARYAELF